MRYRKLTADGDMTFGNQQADFYRDQPEAPAQSIKTRLGLISGEWYLNEEEGTPYQSILGKYTEQVRDPLIRERILGSQGVTSIVSYSSSFDGETRTFTVDSTVNTLYGQASISEIL